MLKSLHSYSTKSLPGPDRRAALLPGAGNGKASRGEAASRTSCVFLQAPATGSRRQTDKVGCPFSQGCQHAFQHVPTKARTDAHQTPEEKADLYLLKPHQGLLQRVVHNERKLGLNWVVRTR